MPPDGITLLQPVTVSVPKEEAAKYNYAKPQTAKFEKITEPVSVEKRKENFELFSKAIGIPSIASLKQKEQKLQEASESNVEVILQRNNNFDAPQFKVAWNEICERIKEKGRDSLFATLTMREPTIDYSTYIIKLNIDNKVQEQDIQREKPWILETLRDMLQNDTISFEINLSENSAVAQPYTNREKFMKMAEKNKALIYLAEKLKLEL